MGPPAVVNKCAAACLHDEEIKGGHLVRVIHGGRRINRVKMSRNLERSKPTAAKKQLLKFEPPRHLSDQRTTLPPSALTRSTRRIDPTLPGRLERA